MSWFPVGNVRVKACCSHLLATSQMHVLFGASLKEAPTSTDDFQLFEVLSDHPPSQDLTFRIQKYVDDLCGEGCSNPAGGEDSSYDSDYEADQPLSSSSSTFCQHQDVSRTTSDTLAAEYAEYVQSTPSSTEFSPGYTAKVEFALKLGYTEKLVQTALQKLGPQPTQNELLEELIKLGAQKSIELSPEGIEHEQEELPGVASPPSPTLRPIVIDGSNVAMSHGNKEIFSCRGIKICVDWFKSRGHKTITVFVPKWRKESPRPDNPVKDQDLLAELERERLLVFTPSRFVGGKRLVCYDDRYILKLAAQTDGIVVSNDNYRDLCQESTEFRKVVEERILMYSFVNDRFMPPDDPLGRAGPTLDNFLRILPKKGELPPPCPYGKKCTYGNKCKYHHPERGPLPHKTVTERLSEHAQRHLLMRGEHIPLGRTRSNVVQQKDVNQHSVVSKSRSVDNVANENLHKKLARQLTINPVRCCLPPPNSWGMHQHVTRIASAPDSYRNWPPGALSTPPPSCSDPQLNSYWISPTEDARRKLHYHLAAIFPEEQVCHVMQMYPEETNPQKICAAILAMFPKT